MEPRGTTISVGMKLVVLAAVDLAMLRGLPESFLRSPAPIMLYFFVAWNLVVIQGVVLRRPIRAWQATFLVVGLAYFVALTAYTVSNSRAPGTFQAPMYLEAGIRAYRRVTGDYRVFRFNNSAWFFRLEAVVANLVGLLVAWLSGILVERALRRPERPLARGLRAVGDFLAGAMIGLFVHMIVAMGLHAVLPERPPTVLLLGLLACLSVGGGVTMIAVRRRQRARATDDTAGPRSPAVRAGTIEAHPAGGGGP